MSICVKKFNLKLFLMFKEMYKEKFYFFWYGFFVFGILNNDIRFEENYFWKKYKYENGL